MIGRSTVLASLLGLLASPLAPPLTSPLASPGSPLFVVRAPVPTVRVARERPDERAGERVTSAEAMREEAVRFASGDDKHAMLLRWNRLTPLEKGKLRERFERFKEIDAEERERLERRGKRLDLLARHLYRELPEEDRARMDALPAAKRRELMREMAADKARDVGQRIHDKLPPGTRRRLEQASPDDRAKFMEEFPARRRARMDAALGRLGEQLDIEESIIKRICNLPDDQRGRKFLEFLQRRALVEVGRYGLPEGMDIERWKEIGNLPGDEFFEAVMELRETYPALAMPPSEIREMSEAKRRLIFAGRARHAERIELSDRDPAERRVEITRRRRERVERLLREEEWLAPDELDELSTLSDGLYLAEVRRRIFLPAQADGVTPEAAPAARTGN